MANLLLIDVETRDGIATVRLNRPDKRNAMSFDLLRDLLATAKRLQRDRSLRVVLLAGAGESFSAGIDLGELNNPRNRAFAFRELLKPGQSLFQKAFLAWQELPVPVIAVLHGHCFGAGMQLALAADIRISTPDCQLSMWAPSTTTCSGQVLPVIWPMTLWLWTSGCVTAPSSRRSRTSVPPAMSRAIQSASSVVIAAAGMRGCSGS